MRIRRTMRALVATAACALGLLGATGAPTLAASMPAAHMAAPAHQVAAPPQTDGGLSATAIDLIARMVVAEEGNRSYQDQLGVAAVIMNRLRNGGFGKTVDAVLFAPYQFTPVLNGYFWNVSPTPTALRAARAAANGADPTGGALYFFDPGQGVSSSWIYSRHVTKVIDGTVYAR